MVFRGHAHCSGKNLMVKFSVLATALVTAVLTSVFWIWLYSSASSPEQQDGSVMPSGDKATIQTPGAGTITIAEGVTVGPAGLAVPVAGLKVTALTDTFTQARAGGARVHDAIDIMAPAGTAVVAAAPGVLEKLFFSKGGGGITAYVRSEDRRWIYYYAHLQGYAAGLAEGQLIQRGQVIGFVGSTGNASNRGPHLHFAIHKMDPGEKWYQGSAVNPYPLLASQQDPGKG